MKKIICILAALLIIASSAYAGEITIETVSITDNAVVVSYNTSDMAEEDYVTVLTYMAESADAEPDESNIKYIDQITKSGNTSVQFNLSDTPSGTYQIKMGGTNVQAPDSVSVTVDEKMSGTLNYMNNPLSLFTGPVTGGEFFMSHENKPVILKPEEKVIAAFSTVPTLYGYTVKEYGIRINTENYSAKVNLTSDSKYAMLFKGAGITADMNITAMPYVVYEKDGAEDITYYGSTTISGLTAVE